MGRGKLLKPGQIAVIMAFCQAGQQNKQIHDITGINIRSIQRWTKKFRDTNGDVQLQRRSTGRPKKISATTLRWMGREIEKDPTLTAGQLKEMSHTLQDVHLDAIRKALRVDLKYQRRVAKKKP